MSKANVLLLSALLFFTVQSTQFETSLLQTFSQSKELANHPTGKVIKSYISLVSHLSEVTDRSVKYKQLYQALDLVRQNLIDTKKGKIEQLGLDYSEHTSEILRLKNERDTAETNYKAAKGAVETAEKDKVTQETKRDVAIKEQTRLNGLITTAKNEEIKRKEEYEKESKSLDSAITEAGKAKVLLAQLVGSQKTSGDYSFLETANQNRKEFLHVIQTKIANFYKSGPYALQRTIIAALIQAASNQDKFTDQVVLDKVVKLVDQLIVDLQNHKATIDKQNIDDLDAYSKELTRLNGLLTTADQDESDAIAEITRLIGVIDSQTKIRDTELGKWNTAKQDIEDENKDWSNLLDAFKKFIQTYNGEIQVLDSAESKLTNGGIIRPNDLVTPVDNLTIPAYAV